MQFGVCIPAAQSAAAKAGGWDFVEENVQGYFRGQADDWVPPTRPALPLPSANSLVPGGLPIVGPNADSEALTTYMTRVLQRARAVGMRTLVFGSGAARNVPADVARTEAVDQITAFLAESADIAKTYEITLVIEPLNRGECNIINTVAEAMTYVERVKHPNLKCLVDSYHFWLEDEPPANLEAAMPHIAHVHVADRDGRTAPGESGTSDYGPFMKMLKAGGYDGLIAVECRGFDLTTNGPRSLKVLRDSWASA